MSMKPAQCQKSKEVKTLRMSNGLQRFYYGVIRLLTIKKGRRC